MFGPRAQGLPNGLPLAAGAKADAERGAAACVCARGMVKSGKEPLGAATGAHDSNARMRKTT